MGHVHFLLSFIFFFCFSTPAYSLDSLSLGDFLKRVEENDPRLKEILLESEKAHFLVDQSMPNSGADVTGSFVKGFDSESDSDTSVLNGELSKEVISTGTAFSLSHTHTTRPDRKEDVTQMRVKQNLYKNAFGRDNRLLKKSLEQKKDALILTVSHSHETYLKEILFHYLDYQKVWLDFEASEISLRETRRIGQSVQNKYRKKIASRTDLDKIQLQILLRREDHLQKKKDLDLKWTSIQELMGADAALAPPRVNHSFDSLVERFNSPIPKKENISSLRSIRAGQLESSQSESMLLLSQRKSHPDFKLLAGYDLDQSDRFSSSVNRKEFILGLELTLPLWNSQLRAEEKSAFFQHQKNEVALQVKRQEVQSSLEELKLRINELKSRLEITNQKVLLSQKILKAETRRYRYGKMDLDKLIEIEQDAIEYRFQHQSVQLELHKAILDWMDETDQLLTKRHLL